MNDEPTQAENCARDNLRRLAAQRGVTFASLSKALGKNQAYIAQYLSTFAPKRLQYEQRCKLAMILDTDPRAFDPQTAEEWAKNPDSVTKSQALQELEQIGTAAIQQPIWSEVDIDSMIPLDTHTGKKHQLLPVFGTVSGGDDTVLVNGIPQGLIERPHALRNEPDAYALRVTGESMAPKFAPGDTIVVSPHKRYIKGSYVVVALQTDSGVAGVIKQFDREDAENIYLNQFNPAEAGKVLCFSKDKVMSIHKVISTIEGS